MELIKTRNLDFQFEDNRGSLTQLVHEGFDQINVLVTKQGVTRGGHYHKQCTEAFYIISGSIKVTAAKEEAEITYHFGKGDFFQIEPYVMHSMYFPENCTMVQMYNRCVENADGTKDIFTE